MKKRLKFMKNGIIENRIISVFYKKDLLFGLSMIDKNKYTIITVLDENMRVIKLVYEEEIINALKEHGNITFEELIKIKSNGWTDFYICVKIFKCLRCMIIVNNESMDCYINNYLK